MNRYSPLEDWYQTEVGALRKENAVTNNGRGSSVIRNMLIYLDRSEPTAARIVWETDKDKVRQYPKLYALAVRLGFEE